MSQSNGLTWKEYMARQNAYAAQFPQHIAAGDPVSQQCGSCGAFLPKPKSDDRWRVCTRCGMELETR